MVKRTNKSTCIRLLMERWRKQRRLRGIVYFEEINKQTVFEPVLTMWKHDVDLCEKDTQGRVLLLNCGGREDF